MDAGNLIVLLLVGGGLFAMFAMHRGGGHSHGGGGHSHGAGGGCGGGHGHGPSEAPREEQKPLLGKPGSGVHEHEREPAVAEGKHRGC